MHLLAGEWLIKMIYLHFKHCCLIFVQTQNVETSDVTEGVFINRHTLWLIFFYFVPLHIHEPKQQACLCPSSPDVLLCSRTIKKGPTVQLNQNTRDAMEKKFH